MKIGVGTFEAFSKDFKVPLRILFRKSALSLAEDQRDEFFNLMEYAIVFFEGLFESDYPFAKLDLVFDPVCPRGFQSYAGSITL